MWFRRWVFILLVVSRLVGFVGGAFGGVRNCFYLCTRKRARVFSFFRLRMRGTRWSEVFSDILWDRKLFVPLQNQRQKAGVTEEVIDIMNKGIAPFSDFGAMRTNK